MTEKHSPLQTSGIKLKDKIGYALGDAAGLLTFSLVGSFLQMFYTNVLYIQDVSKITLLFLIARIWDAVNDPIWGFYIDSRKPGKHGRFKPYLRWGSIPLAIAGVLMFVKIPNLSENQYLAYAYVTYICYGMMYTVVNIPYGSLASVITSDESERSALSMFRSIGAGLGGVPALVLLPMFIYDSVEGSESKLLNGNKLLIGVIIFAVLSIIVYQLCYAMSKERVTAPAVKKNSNARKTIAALFHNRPFITLCIASMLLIATQQYTQTTYNYLFLDYFKKPELYMLVTVFTYLPMALLLPILQKVVRRFGKKEVCAAGMALSFAANLALWLLKTESTTVFFVFCFLSGLGMTFFIMEIWAMVTDVINYQETLSGQRDEGTSYAFFSFTRKLGQTLAGVSSTGVLGLIGYDAKNVTEQAMTGMYNVSTVLPAVMCFLMAAILWFLYPLSKSKLRELYENKNNTERTEIQ